MKNYDSVVQQLQDAGLIINEGLTLGKIARTRVEGDREQRGWYSLHEVSDNAGDRIIVGTFGVWHGNDNGAQKVALKRGAVSKEQSAAIRKRIADDRRRAAAARERKAAQAAARAAATWKNAKPWGEAEYLEQKGIKAHGVRFTESGSIVIPMLDASGNVHGLQFVLPKDHPRRKKTGRNKEYWPAGLKKQGHYFKIGGIRDMCLACEGYATGASLHEATGYPVVVAFDANNLRPVCESLQKTYKNVRILICADDDYLTDGNPGESAAETAALAVSAAWLSPVFADDRDGKKITDFNDLYLREGSHVVTVQVENKLRALGWLQSRTGVSVRPVVSAGGSNDDDSTIRMLTVDEAVARYCGTYGFGGDVLFDGEKRRLVHKKDVANLLPRHAIDEMRWHPDWRIALDTEIGFDPTEKDPDIKCNLFGGWPTEPAEGECTRLLELLEYLCDKEPNRDESYQFILKWLAYPLQHRGAKMHSAIVVHGPQGTGKSRFFEAYAKIFGPYAKVLGQEALEDRFNADWAEKKLFILADEVLARSDMYHVKNRLKGFITGDTIRVNPKNIAAHNEKNQMNIVFLSNERQPLVLENDDRRHCVIWAPPKPPDGFFKQLNDEIDSGGIEALHYYLLNLDLGDFKPWTRPPMTVAKQDLIDHSAGSEERFIKDWIAGELEGADGEPLPVCPCLGSSLYRLYDAWCRANGEFRPRPANHFIGYLGKMHGWSTGKSERTFENLSTTRSKNRRMVIPSAAVMANAAKNADEGSSQHLCIQDPGETKTKWLTKCFFKFEEAAGNL